MAEIVGNWYHALLSLFVHYECGCHVGYVSSVHFFLKVCYNSQFTIIILH